MVYSYVFKNHLKVLSLDSTTNDRHSARIHEADLLDALSSWAAPGAAKEFTHRRIQENFKKKGSLKLDLVYACTEKRFGEESFN